MYELSILEVDGFWYDVDDIRDGATVEGGGVKNDRSSRVSKKSL